MGRYPNPSGGSPEVYSKDWQRGRRRHLSRSSIPSARQNIGEYFVINKGVCHRKGNNISHNVKWEYTLE